jgi:UDP-glucuronate 4-epimerase
MVPSKSNAAITDCLFIENTGSIDFIPTLYENMITMSKNILITGAAGFVGYHLSLKLNQRGDKVIGFDNFNDYYDPKLKKNREAELIKSGIKVIHGDICDVNALERVISENKITHIAHLAAQAGVRYSLVNPHAYTKTNIDGFLNVLEACKKFKLKLTYASSSSVYGNNTKIPFSENDRTESQASLYGVTKKSNELMAYTYHHLYEIPVTGLRFFTVYGPWGRPDMAYFSFTEAILSGTPIELFNHGKMIRDFTYIEDIVQGTVAAIDLESPHEIFNLGNNQPVELIEFVKIIEKAVGKKANIRFKDMQPGDVVKTYADIEHSQAKLGYQAKTKLEVGIPHFVDWYLQYNNASC